MKRVGLLFALVLALAAWSFGFEPGWLQQRDLTLQPVSWSGKPITIAVATDLHIGAPHAGPEMLTRVVDRLLASRPDLILLPGDFVIQNVVGGQSATPESIANELSRLQAPLGVFATLGNHDWWFDGPRVRRALEAAGITVIENGAVPLKAPYETLWLVGIGDDMTGHADPARALAAVPAGARSIVMMHDPANATALTADTLLAVAGHTHGGQVRLPFIGALITPGRSPRSHAYGWIPDVAAPTWVSSGIGTSILPIRFNCPPEIVVIHLARQSST